MRWLITATCLAIASGIWAAEPKPAPNDEIDLLFLEKTRPYHFRLHVQFNGKSYQDHWQGVIEQLFRHIDSDGNGAISLKELEAAPSADQFRLIVEGNPEIEASPPPEPADIADNMPAGFNLLQMRAYYQRSGVGPWQIRLAFRPTPPLHLDDALIRALDAKNPDMLTRADFGRARQLPTRLDSDHDEMITALELDNVPRATGFVMQRPTPNREFWCVHFEPSPKGRQVLAAKLIARYDADSDGKLAPKEIAFLPAVFGALDANRSGKLEPAELERWPDQPVEVELVVRMDVPHREGSVVALGPAATKPRVTQSRIGSVRVQFPRDEVEILRIDGGDSRPRNRQPAPIDDFQGLDRNNDGILDHQEIFQPPFRYVPYLRLADRNHDNKLGRKEIEDYLAMQKRLYTRMTTVTLVDRADVLYELLDSDHDARLSMRELRNAWTRVLPWADEKAGTLPRKQMPRQYQILLSHGALAPPDGDPGKGRIIRGVDRLHGPTWFRKMDRNADGDISRSEFLGTAEQFHKLDRDGDGLIDAEEAAAASPKKQPQ